MIKLLTSIKRFLPQRDNKRLLYTSAANCLVWAAFFLIVLSTPAWADEAFKRHCPTLNEYLTDGQGSNCLLCGIYRIVMAACAQVVTGSWNAFAASGSRSRRCLNLYRRLHFKEHSFFFTAGFFRLSFKRQNRHYPFVRQSGCRRLAAEQSGIFVQ